MVSLGVGGLFVLDLFGGHLSSVQFSQRTYYVINFMRHVHTVAGILEKSDCPVRVRVLLPTIFGFDSKATCLLHVMTVLFLSCLFPTHALVTVYA